jgi:capsular exopolysaccharide synthesis family protein
MSSRGRTLILGGILGVFLGIGLAFFLEYLDNTIRTPDDVQHHLGLPVLGVIPRAAEAKRAEVPPLILQEGSSDVSAEAYRSLRTNLLLHTIEDPLGTVMVTSLGPGEGKSITVANLGIALAQAGQNVLLVDADLRRPMLHRIFDLDRDKGLSMVLAEKSTADQVTAKTDIANLSVLVAGTLPANPSEILGSPQMKHLISQLREQYDTVLFDSAPLSGMTDATVLSSKTDGTVLVVKTGEVPHKALKALVEHLQQLGTRICGVILNYIDIKRCKYYDYYYYYSYDYAKGKEVKKRKSKHGAAKKALNKLLMEPSGNLIRFMSSAVGHKTTKPKYAGEAPETMLNQTPAVDANSTCDSGLEPIFPGKTGTRSRKEYGERHHTEGKPRKVVELFRTVDSFCRGLDSGSIQRRYLATYVKYTYGKNIFCCVCLRKSGLRVYLKLNYSDLTNPPQYVRDVSNIGHSGVGDVELAIDSLERFQNARVFVQKSLEVSINNDLAFSGRAKLPLSR